MGKTFQIITPELQEWIEKQKMFFVGTAPLSSEGHVNISPKGLDSFRVMSPTCVAYQDLTGSGVETIAHVKENKRIVIMFCAFEGPPKIVRLYGQGEVILPDNGQYSFYEEKFPKHKSTRAFINISLSLIQDSCVYGVPFFDYKSERDTLTKWADAKGENGILEYRALKNKQSIDGLTGI